MLRSEINKIRENIEKLEDGMYSLDSDKEGSKVFLDFNRDGSGNKDNVFLLSTIPPMSKWKCK